MTATISTANGTLTKPNILILISDQTRAPQHWPDGWVAQHLPVMNRLMSNGLTFTNAFTPASECCPARASFVTSTYPEENGVRRTVSYLTPGKFKNLANVLHAAGYPVVWKGKWHLSGPVDGTWSAKDIAALDTNFQMQRWNPPDAGTGYGGGSDIGGGTPDNDGRFVNGVTAKGQTPGWGESAVDFINHQPLGSPWCLVVSLVNPHDVLLYPTMMSGTGYPDSAYGDIGICLPPNLGDDLSTKPAVQLAYRNTFDGKYPLANEQEQLNYVNFYAYLQTLVDGLFGDVLNALDGKGLTDDTLIIRIADHGEMGLSHGMREKVYNAYEETIRMPFIVSNKTLWPAAMTSDALISTLDLVPTLAAIVGSTGTSGLRGVNQLDVIEGKTSSIRDNIVYTFDDVFELSQDTPNSHIRTLRTSGWKYSVYFGGPTFEYEMYDLANDPLEMTNLLYGTPGAAAIAQWKILHPELTNELEDLGAMPHGANWPGTPWQ